MNRTIDTKNISSDWEGSTKTERIILAELIKKAEKGLGLKYFCDNSSKLSDYWYWLALGTIWVDGRSYRHRDLEKWKRLFKAKRTKRATSLMKPDEYNIFQQLEDSFLVYRIQKPNEEDWISYCLIHDIAAKAAKNNNIKMIAQYEMKKDDAIALFARAGEAEIICLKKQMIVNTIKVT